jgi:hypothetical protein
MDPNSANQTWSKWTIVVRPGLVVHRSLENVRANVGPFFLKAFGSTTTCKMRQTGRVFVFELLTEGKPVQDEEFVKFCKGQMERFFVNGFGPGTTLGIDVRLAAGERPEGGPRDQLVVIPSLVIPAGRMM